MEQEQKELDLLLGKGIEIETKLFGRKKVWRTKPMTAGRLLKMSDVHIKMIIDEEALNSGEFLREVSAQYQAVNKNAKKVAKVLAIAVSDNPLMIRFLTRHFLNNLTAAQLKDFAVALLKRSDYENFITSIVLMNGNRLTKANTVEQQD